MTKVLEGLQRQDFKMLWGNTIPKYTATDAKGLQTVVEVIAGKLADQQAPAAPPDSWASGADNHVAIWNIAIPAEGQFVLPAAGEVVALVPLTKVTAPAPVVVAQC